MFTKYIGPCAIYVVPFAIALIATAAVADHCRPVQRIKLVEEVPVQFINVPAYGAGYSETDNVLREILAELRRLNERIDKIDRAQPVVMNFEAVAKNRCASCHTAAVQGGSKPGGDFVMFEADGKVAAMSLESKKLIRLLVTSKDANQRMPKNKPPLPDAEAQILAFGPDPLTK